MNEREWFEVLIDSLGGFDAIRPQVFFKKCCHNWREINPLFDHFGGGIGALNTKDEAYNIASCPGVWEHTNEYVNKNNIKTDEQEFVELF